MDEFKLPWLLTFLFSLVYLASFVIAAFRDSKEYQVFLQSISWLNQNDSGLLIGFCVWGHPDMPNDKDGCNGEPLNSHNFAFLVDMVMMIAVGVLWIRDAKDRNLASRYYTVVYAAFLGLCLTHGIAHFWLFFSDIDCAKWEGIGGIYLWFGYFVLVVLVLLIAYVCFRSILGMNTCSAFGLSLLAAFFTSLLIYFVVDKSGSYWSIQCVFVVTHPLASGTVLYSARVTDPPADHSWIKAQKCGWAFMMATIMGCLELDACLKGFRSAGGHCWYDFWLGVALIFALPYFRTPDTGSHVQEASRVGERAPLTEASVPRYT